MKTVHYYDLNIIERQVKRMPAGAVLLGVIEVRGNPRIYALVDRDSKYEERVIRIFGTGHEIDADTLRYIGTIKQENDTLVWHVFEELTEN